MYYYSFLAESRLHRREKNKSREEIKHHLGGTSNSILFHFNIRFYILVWFCFLLLQYMSISVYFQMICEALFWQTMSQWSSNSSRRPNRKVCKPTLLFQLSIASCFWKGLVYFSEKVISHFVLHSLVAFISGIWFQASKHWDKSWAKACPSLNTTSKSSPNFSPF